MGSNQAFERASNLITASQIINFRNRSDDYFLTDEIKKELTLRRQERIPFHLTKDEFDKILHWKLRGQYKRIEHLLLTLTEEMIVNITRAAFMINLSNPDDELELQLRILTCLRGVGVPVASAILALVYPDKYAVIDYRGWRQVIGETKTNFSISDYKRYLSSIRILAEELGWFPQEVDLAIWTFDTHQSSKMPI